MAGVFDFLHLKRNTKGSSNELSFDVLDAASNDLNSKRKKTRLVISTPQTIKPVATDKDNQPATVKNKPKHEKAQAKSAAGEEAKKREKKDRASAKDNKKSQQKSEKRQRKQEARALKQERQKQHAQRRLETSTAQTVKPSRGTSHGVKKNSKLSAVPEVEKRKKRRQARRIRLAILSTVLLIGVIGAAVFFGYQYYQGRVSFEGRYADLIGLISKEDEQLVKLDDILSKPSSQVSQDDVRTIESLAPQAEENLKAIKPQLDNMAGDAVREKDTAALTVAAKAIDGRVEMLGYVQEASKLYDKANKAGEDAARAWDNVMQADQLARQAIEEANSASTVEQFEAANEKTGQAIEQMEAARKELADVATLNEGAVFSSQDVYLAKRIEALGHALAVNDALVSGDKQKAADENNAYNAADAEVVHMASSLPVNPVNQARAPYTTKQENVLKKYQEAREALAYTDSQVRSYL